MQKKLKRERKRKGRKERRKKEKRKKERNDNRMHEAYSVMCKGCRFFALGNKDQDHCLTFFLQVGP